MPVAILLRSDEQPVHKADFIFFHISYRLKGKRLLHIADSYKKSFPAIAEKVLEAVSTVTFHAICAEELRL